MKPPKFIAAYNDLVEIIQYAEKGEFTAVARIAYAHLLPEADAWNGMTLKERDSIKDRDLELSFPKIPVKLLPKYVNKSSYPALAPLVKGQMPEGQSQLEKLLKDETNKDSTPTA